MTTSNLLIRPAERLLRRLRLGGKLTVLALAALWPLLTMVALAALVPAWPLWPVALAGGALLIYLMAAFHAAFVGEFQRVFDVMSQTASGNLRAQIRTDGSDEMAELARLLDRMIGSVSAMVAEVRSNSALVAHAGQSLASGNRELADRTEQQAANLEQTAAAVCSSSPARWRRTRRPQANRTGARRRCATSPNTAPAPWARRSRRWKVSRSAPRR
jgi:methyl-accepting chemotaxis protein